MDLELSTEQALLDDSLRGLFADHAGHRRAADLHDGLDRQLLDVLAAQGFLDVLAGAGPIEAVLVAERAAGAAAAAPVIARVLVGPLAGFHDLPDAVGLVASPTSLVRYAGLCDAYLVLDGDTAALAAAADVEVEPVASRAGYPMGRVRALRSTALGAGSGDALRRAWQVGIAAEAGATALAAVEFASRHVRDRVQFGRPIGSFQAVQHRLARSYSMAQATRWLARRGAWCCADEYCTAAAATFACLTARETYDNTHQVVGGIGITTEYGMTQWTMRLLALHTELGGRTAHASRVAAHRAAHVAAVNLAAQPDDLSELGTPSPADR
jgi:alkylation response protein AidB-like acyl-CoA dehydrogenase